MKLVPKLALTILVGVFAVVAVFTAWRVRGEIETFNRDIRRDHRIIGLTAAAALAKTRTREEAIRLARRIDASRERIGVRFVSLGPSADAATTPVVQVTRADAPAPGQWVQMERPVVQAGSASEFLVTYVGAPVVDDAYGALELTESLTPRAAYISRGVASALGSSAAMVLVCSVIVVTIGATMVGKPVSELIAAARRIGAGDFEVLGTIRRRDEFGELAWALRSMSSELRTARLQMTAEVEARIRALEQLRHAERLATLGQLASVLAHEIGTPLNVIGGHAKLISTSRLNEGGIRESSQAIGIQCERMTQIIRRMLDYARRGPPRRAWIQASDVMRQARDLLSGLAEQRRVQLVFEGTDSGDELFADAVQLQQAVINLVMNAIQASSSGSPVHLTITTTSGPAGREGTPYIVLTVQDRGEGIGSELQERIFEPFFTTKPPGEGTGLGLTVARDIVHEHGGFVEVSSHVDQGSTFHLYLPRGAAECRLEC